MAWSRTLGGLVLDVTDRADVSGFVARHPVGTVRRRVIESYRAMRGWMIDQGSLRWMTSRPALLDSAQAVPADYGIHYPLIDSIGNRYCKPQKVETLLAGRWRELPPGVLGDVYQFAPQISNEPQMWIPTGFNGFPSGAPSEPSTIDYATESIFVIPVTNTNYPIRIWASSLINLEDNDASELFLDGPGFDWIIWDCVIKITARDNDSKNTYAIALREREKVEEQIKANIRTEVKSRGPRRDVFQLPRRRRGYYYTW